MNFGALPSSLIIPSITIDSDDSNIQGNHQQIRTRQAIPHPPRDKSTSTSVLLPFTSGILATTSLVPPTLESGNSHATTTSGTTKHTFGSQAQVNPYHQQSSSSCVLSAASSPNTLALIDNDRTPKPNHQRLEGSPSLDYFTDSTIPVTTIGSDEVALESTDLLDWTSLIDLDSQQEQTSAQSQSLEQEQDLLLRDQRQHSMTTAKSSLTPTPTPTPHFHLLNTKTSFSNHSSKSGSPISPLGGPPTGQFFTPTSTSTIEVGAGAGAGAGTGGKGIGSREFVVGGELWSKQVGGGEKIYGRGSLDFPGQNQIGSFSSHGGSFSSAIIPGNGNGNIYSSSPPPSSTITNETTITPLYHSSLNDSSLLMNNTMQTQYASSSRPTSSSGHMFTPNQYGNHGTMNTNNTNPIQQQFANQQLQNTQNQPPRPQQQQEMMLNSALPPISQDFARPNPNETRRPATSAGIMYSGGGSGSSGNGVGSVSQSGRFPLPSVTGGVIGGSSGMSGGIADWSHGGLSVGGGGGGGGGATGTGSGLDGRMGTTPAQVLLDKRRKSMHGMPPQQQQSLYVAGMSGVLGMVKEDSSGASSIGDGSGSGSYDVRGGSVRPSDLRMNSSGSGVMGGYSASQQQQQQYHQQQTPAQLHLQQQQQQQQHMPTAAIAHARRNSDYSDLFAHSIDQIPLSASAPMPISSSSPSSIMPPPSSTPINNIKNHSNSLIGSDLRRASASAAMHHQTYPTSSFASVGGGGGGGLAGRPDSSGGVRAPGSSNGVRFQTNPSSMSQHPSQYQGIGDGSDGGEKQISPTTNAVGGSGGGQSGGLNNMAHIHGLSGIGPMDLSGNNAWGRRASEPHFKYPLGQQVNLPSQSRLYGSLGMPGQDPQIQRQFANFHMAQLPGESGGMGGLGGGGGYMFDQRRGSIVSSGMMSSHGVGGGGGGGGGGGESRRPSFAGSSIYAPPGSAGSQYAQFPSDYYRFGGEPHGYPGPSPNGQSFDHGGPPMNWPPSSGGGAGGGETGYYPTQHSSRSDSYAYDPSSTFSNGDPRGSIASIIDRRSSTGNQSQRRESQISTGEDGSSSNGGGQHDPLSGPVHKKRPRRKFDQIERLYLCGFEGCEKSYGTLNHLNAHVYMQKHGIKRRPEEFKDIRKAWKKKKKEDAAAAVASGGSVIPSTSDFTGMNQHHESNTTGIQQLMQQHPLTHAVGAAGGHWVEEGSQRWA